MSLSIRWSSLAFLIPAEASARAGSSELSSNRETNLDVTGQGAAAQDPGVPGRGHRGAGVFGGWGAAHVPFPGVGAGYAGVFHERKVTGVRAFFYVSYLSGEQTCQGKVLDKAGFPNAFWLLKSSTPLNQHPSPTQLKTRV